MKHVQSIVGRLVQRVAGKSRKVSAPSSGHRPVEVDAQSLRHIAGGNGSAQLPTKGW